MAQQINNVRLLFLMKEFYKGPFYKFVKHRCKYQICHFKKPVIMNYHGTMLKIDVILDLSFKEISDNELPWYHVKNRCNIGYVI